MRKRVRYIGRVQGVGFRVTAMRIAIEHAIVGWVRNEPDGSVLMECQAPPEVLEAYLAALAGEMEAYIRSANAIEIPKQSGEHGFEITYS